MCMIVRYLQAAPGLVVTEDLVVPEDKEVKAVMVEDKSIAI